jgi:Flp pilus assembly pilin Flp
LSNCTEARQVRATGSSRKPGPLFQSGQGLVEYGLILVIMAVACVFSLVFFSDQLSSLLSMIGQAV